MTISFSRGTLLHGVGWSAGQSVSVADVIHCQIGHISLNMGNDFERMWEGRVNHNTL
jgi:hypothetical protein